MSIIVEQLKSIVGDYIDYLGVARIKKKVNNRGAEEEKKVRKVLEDFSDRHGSCKVMLA
jgi:hypothetical protein